MKLNQYPETLAVVRFGPGSEIPAWAESSSIFSITATALTGILSSLLAPLSEAGISVFTISTFDTDWLLVPVADADRAAEEWRRSGHEVAPAVPATPPRKKQR